MPQTFYIRTPGDSRTVSIKYKKYLGDMFELDKKTGFVGMIVAAWKELADKEISNTTGAMGRDYVDRYKTAIGGQVEDEGRASFTLTGMPANRIEHGWAPDGPTMESGLGKYDGHEHDMRVFMLTSKDRNVIKMKVARTAEQIAGEARDRAEQTILKYAGNEKSRQYAATRAKVIQERILHGFQESKGLLDLDVGESISRRLTKEIGKERTKHLRALYHRVTRTEHEDNARKFLFSTFRTITRSEKQMKRKLWFTKGNAPANLMPKLAIKIMEIIVSEFK